MTTTLERTGVFAPLAGQGNVWPKAWCFAGISLLLCVLLGNRNGLWLDEYYTLLAVRLGWLDMIRERLDDGHSPLPFFYARIFNAISPEERVLRLSSAIGAAGVVLGLTRLALSLGLRRYLPAVWGLSVANPFLLYVGTQYRYMVLLIAVTAFCAAAAVDWERLRTRESGRTLILWMTLLLWIHPTAMMAWFSLGAFLVWGQWNESKRFDFRVMRKTLKPLLVSFLIFLPLLVFILDHDVSSDRHNRPWYNGFARYTETFFAHETLWPRVIERHFQSFHHDASLILVTCELLILGLGILLMLKELKGRQWDVARRMIACLFLGVPLIFLMIKAVKWDARLSASYMTFAFVPFCLTFAVALISRAGNGLQRWFFRLGLVGLLAIQLAGAGLDKGRLHRETVEWITAIHQGTEPIAISREDVNRLAFERAGFAHPQLISDIKRKEKDLGKILKVLRRQAKESPRGFVLLYDNRAPILDAVQKLVEERVFKEMRHIHVSREVQVFAWITSTSQHRWLQDLEPPTWWGPAIGNQ